MPEAVDSPSDLGSLFSPLDASVSPSGVGRAALGPSLTKCGVARTNCVRKILFPVQSFHVFSLHQEESQSNVSAAPKPSKKVPCQTKQGSGSESSGKVSWQIS